MKKALFNWSGGKDSAFALGKVLDEKEYNINFLLTSINKASQRVSMHGVHKALMLKQIEAIGMHVQFLELPDSPNMDTYEAHLKKLLLKAKKKGIEYSIFGDINLEDLRAYREKQLSKLAYKAVFPLWKLDTYQLVMEFIDQGYKSIITAADASKLPKEFVGQVITKELIKELPKNVDPCGENGEFHSFVVAAPYFKNNIEIEIKPAISKSYQQGKLKFDFWFSPIQLKETL